MAAGSPEFAVRPAKWPDDYDAVCAVRKPTEFVVEDGGAGFMGQRVAIVDPEEAQQRRVQARLSSALRDNATVLLVEDPPGGGSVVGTLDCVLQEHSRDEEGRDSDEADQPGPFHHTPVDGVRAGDPSAATQMHHALKAGPKIVSDTIWTPKPSAALFSHLQ